MKKVIIFGVLVSIVLILLHSISPGVEAGNKAVDFTLEDIDGNKVSLKDYKGQNVVLLVFSTTWCPSCNSEVPELKKLHEQFSGKGLKIVDVFIQESKAKVGSKVSKEKIPYTVLLDLDGEVAKQYSIHGVPTLLVIDKEGTIVKRGYPPSSRFIPLIEDLLK